MRTAIIRAVLRGRHRGVTLMELIVGMTVLTIGVVGSMGSFSYITKAVSASRLKTIATNLAQEKMEMLKNKSYYQLLVTTQTATSTGYNPNFVYDSCGYAPETISLWGLPPLHRVVNIDYASVMGTSVSTVPYTSNDTGMKKISVYVYWNERATDRKVQIDSYYENPSVAVLNTGIKGQVTSASGGAVASALVEVVGKPRWRAYSDSSGNYTFQVSPGSYSVVCSSINYYSVTVNGVNVQESIYYTWNPQLIRIATGTIYSDSVYAVSSGPVISQVVVSTIMANQSDMDVEYLELFNPTTVQINIANVAAPPGTATSANRYVKLNFKSTCSNPRECIDIELVYNSTYIASGWYYLIANTSTFVQNGSTYTADAYYTDNSGAVGTCTPTPPPQGVGNDWYTAANPPVRRIMNRGHNGAVWLTDASGAVIDAVGWKHNSSPIECEGTCVQTTNSTPGGILAGDQIVRFSTRCVASDNAARAYDTANNSNDFYYNNAAAAVGMPYRVFNSTTASASVTANTRPADILSGIPATGGYVFANDGNSSGVLTNDYTVSGVQGQVCSGSSFTLTGVATGTWSVTMLTSGSSGTISNVWTGSQTGFSVKVASPTTVPPWRVSDHNHAVLTDTYSGGLAVGKVYGSDADYSKPLANLWVGSSAGGAVKTDSQGWYVLNLTTGLTTVTANCAPTNSQYLSSDYVVTVVAGAVTSVPDFHLSQGGVIKGFVTPGTGALPNIVVQATSGSSTFEDTTDETGYFYISASTVPSTLPYSVKPSLDVLQSYTATAKSGSGATVAADGSLTYALTTAGSSVLIGTFTVAGGMGTITGSVTYKGQAITTGVLILASQADILEPPAAVTAATSPGATPVYAVSSQADGTYTLEVRAGTGYKLRAFYPLVDPISGAISYPGTSCGTSYCSQTGTQDVTAGVTYTGKDFAW